jgi:hypothetical protein
MGGMSAAAQNQIMLVRQEPPSFGFRRLSAQASVHPDLGFFVSQQGVPNFLAETGRGDRHYFILYYLSSRKAYVCRIRGGRSEVVEFAGPYPITAREYRMLDAFRKDPSHAPSPLGH